MATDLASTSNGSEPLRKGVLAPSDDRMTFLIIDDHPLFCEALGNALRLSRPGAEILEATSIEGAMAVLATRPSPDLTLLDLLLPDSSGFSGFLRLREAYPRMPVAIISSHEDPALISKVLSMGAAGYLPKSVSIGELTQWIARVLGGTISVARDIEIANQRAETDAARVLRARLAELTPQQMRVLDLIRCGLQNRQIAAELRLADSTVKAYVTEILRKLKLFSRNKAVSEVGKLNLPLSYRPMHTSEGPKEP